MTIPLSKSVMIWKFIPTLLEYDSNHIITGFKAVNDNEVLLYTTNRALMKLTIVDGLITIDDGICGYDMNDMDEVCCLVLQSLTALVDKFCVTEYGYDHEGNRMCWDKEDNFSKFNTTNEELDVQLWMLDDKRAHMKTLIIEFDGKKLDIQLDMHDHVLSIIFDVERIPHA